MLCPGQGEVQELLSRHVHGFVLLRTVCHEFSDSLAPKECHRIAVIRRLLPEFLFVLGCDTSQALDSLLLSLLLLLNAARFSNLLYGLLQLLLAVAQVLCGVLFKRRGLRLELLCQRR